jgi:hypothetical protein
MPFSKYLIMLWWFVILKNKTRVLRENHRPTALH